MPAVTSQCPALPCTVRCHLPLHRAIRMLLSVALLHLPCQPTVSPSPSSRHDHEKRQVQKIEGYAVLIICLCVPDTCPSVKTQ